MNLELIKDILFDAARGSVKSVFTIVRVVIPLMIVMEAGRAYKVLDWLSERTKKVVGMLGLSGASTIPLLVGMFFGLVNGAGIIVQCVREGEIGKKDLYLLTFFLIACHSVIEDTVIFSAIGANGLLLLSIKIISAVIITFVLSRRLNIEDAAGNQLPQ